MLTIIKNSSRLLHISKKYRTFATIPPTWASRNINNNDMRPLKTVLIPSMLLVFLLSACSYDDLVVDNARDQQDVLKRQYIQSSYEKAYAKMRALYPSTFANGKRMATGTPSVEDSFPLWYSDTAIIIDPNDPGIPPDMPPGDVVEVANDSIYAYVFNFSNGQGSMVVSVDDRLPDMLVYSKGRNFMENPFKRFTPKQPDNDLSLWLHTRDSLWRLSYERHQARIREMLANMANATAGEIEDIQTEVRKTYEMQVSIDGYWMGPTLVSADTIQDWHVSQAFKYADGQVPVKWHNTLPMTSKIEEVYGTNAKCWDIIPTMAMYLATFQPDVRADDGWVMDWDAVLNQDTPYDSAEIISNVSRLYYELGLPANLNVFYTLEQSMNAKNRVPNVLANYGLPSGTFKTIVPLGFIIDEIEKGRPAICMIKGLKTRHGSTKVLSFLADDYEYRDQTVRYVYSNSQTINRTYTETFVSLKFSNIDAEQIIPDLYFNWGLLDPNSLISFQSIAVGYYGLQPRQAKTNYEELQVLSTE